MIACGHSPPQIVGSTRAFNDLYKSVNIDENKRTYKRLKSETSERSNFPSRCIVDRHVMQISLSHRRAWQRLK
jgi:hypothetical protein